VKDYKDSLMKHQRSDHMATFAGVVVYKEMEAICTKYGIPKDKVGDFLKELAPKLQEFGEVA
jgi:hypothetical protein